MPRSHSEFTGNERDEIRRIARQEIELDDASGGGGGGTPAPELPTDTEGKLLQSKGEDVPAEFTHRPLLVGVGSDESFDVRPELQFSYDLAPGRQRQRMGPLWESGGFYWMNSSYDTRFVVLIGSDRCYFGAQPSGKKLVLTTDADIVITPSGGGGAGQIDLGRRVTDDAASVGAQTRCWSVTGQTTPVLTVLAPGGASHRWSVFEDGRVERNGVVLAGILTGAADPTGSDGIDGDLYINTTSGAWFGPKSGSTWPTIP